MIAIVVDAERVISPFIEPERAVDAACRFREALAEEHPDARFLLVFDGRTPPSPHHRSLQEITETARSKGWSQSAAARRALRIRLSGEGCDVWWVGAPLTPAQRRSWAAEGHTLHEFEPAFALLIQWGVLLREIGGARVDA